MATKAPELIGINALAYYIKRIQTFLESDKKTISFPNISQELHDVLVRLSENTDFLYDDMFSDNVKMEAAKLAASIQTHGNMKLAYEICDGKFGSNVLMYKKVEGSMFKVPEAQPLRKPSVMTSSTAIEAPADGSVSPIFKTRCLNAATKFVKDDSQLVMRFPEMVTAQAEFIMDMILPGIEGSENADVGFGYRSMYAPLWESMRLFSLKYEYKMVYDTRPVTKEGMKRIVFEKIPKCQTIDLTDSDNESDTPEVRIMDSDHEQTDNGAHSIPIATSVSTKAQKCVRHKVPKHTRKLPKLIKKMRVMMLEGKIPNNFVQDSLRRISEFMMDDQLLSIVFELMTVHEVHFLANVVRFSVNTATYMLFDAECQRHLDDIKYFWNVRRVRYELVWGNKCIVFEKVLSKASEIDSEISEQLNSSFSSTSSASFRAVGSEQKSVESRETSKIEKNVHRKNRIAKLRKKLRPQKLTENFIQATLEDVCDFMNDAQQASIVLQYENVHQTEFIQQLRLIACEEELHALFTEKCRKLLATIHSCLNNNILFKNRAVKGRKVIILEKEAQFNNNQSVKDIRNDITSITSSASSSSLNTDSVISSKFSKKQPIGARIDKKTQKLLDMTYSKLYAGTIKSDVVYNILKNICDFMYDERRDALVLQDLTANLIAFVKVAEYIARDQNLYSVFTNQSQKLLRDLNRCFNRNMKYIVVKRKNQPDTELRLVKEEWYPTKDIIREREQEDRNNENNNNTNIANTSSNKAPLSQSDQERLIRLKAIKDAVASTYGEKSIEHYLQDISNFLLQSNVDRKLTFDDVTEDEALFLKNVNVMSKVKESYALFTRDCQKLLTSIQLNARSYKLTCQMNVDENNHWKFIIEKQSLDEKSKTSGFTRARSLSGGRKLVNAKVQRPARDFSSHRQSHKEKLKAALAQPVQSDKALRMMESMGWKGGALGARGDGIVEPISLPLDLATRAGFGHVPKSKSTPETKLKEAKKLKAKSESEQKKQNPAKPGEDLIPVVMPLKSLATDLLPPGIKSADKCKTVVLQSSYRVVLLRSILEMITTEIDEIHFIIQQNTHKSIGFLKHAVQIFNLRGRFDVGGEVLKQLVREISHILDECRGLMLSSEIRSKNVLYAKPIAVVRKIKLIPIFPKMRKEASSLINSEGITDYRKTNEMSAGDQETTIVWYLDHKVNNESLCQVTQSKHSRMWYCPVESKTRQKARKNPIKVSQNDVPQLKVLALLAVNQGETIGTDVGTINYQKNKTENNQNITKNEHTNSNDTEIIGTDAELATISNDQETTGDKGSKIPWFPKLKENLVSSTWYQIAESACHWNFHVKPNLQHKQKTTRDEIPDGKGLALSAVHNAEIIETDVDMTTLGVHQTTFENNNRKITSHSPDVIMISDGETTEDREQSNGHKTIEHEISTAKEKTATEHQNSDRHIDLYCENPVNQENTVKSIRTSKMVLKIPNMTRKHFSSLTNEEKVVRPERTTYALEIHHYKQNENILTNIKVNKGPPENYPNDRKRMKLLNDQTQQEIMSIPKQQEIKKQEQITNVPERQLTRKQKAKLKKLKKSHGGVLLEKQMIDDCDSTVERYVSKKSKKRIKKTKSSVAERLTNAVADGNITVKIENERANSNTPKMNIMAPMVQNVTPIVKNNTPVIKNVNNVMFEKENKTNGSDTPKTNKVAPMMKNVDIDVAVEKNNESTGNITPKIKMAPIVNENNNLTVKKYNSADNDTPTLNDVKGNRAVQKENDSIYNDVPSAPTMEIVTVIKGKESMDSNRITPNTETDLVSKITKNGNEMINNSNNDTENELESVTYIILVESKKIIIDNNKMTESIYKNFATIETNDLEEKCNDDLCDTDSANRKELHGKGDTQKSELADISNNGATSEKKGKDNTRKFLKSKYTRKKVSQGFENQANEINNDSDNHYDSPDTLIKKEVSLQKLTERRRPSLDSNPNSTSKKFKLLTDFKKIYIVPNDYPQTKIETEKARKIQSAILESIDYTQESVPYLKCHGIQNGGLIYSCQDENSLLFLERLVKNMEDLKVVCEFDIEKQLRYKMAFRINSFIDEPVSNILNRFELYNSELKATKWGVIKKDQSDDFSVIYVDVDEDSFNYICAVNFILYAGNDCARFTILWD